MESRDNGKRWSVRVEKVPINIFWLLVIKQKKKRVLAAARHSFKKK